MDWNTKLGWENLVNPKTACDNPKQQTPDWEFEKAIVDKGPFHLYEGKNSSSGSELAPGSSARSSISVCTDSSFKKKNTQLVNAISGEVGEKEDLGGEQSSPPLESSVGSGESLIALKLGKRMYFENNTNTTASVPVSEIPDSSINVTKMKSRDMKSPAPRCQVEGCNIDLSTAKEYHRKHKVCATHSKCPKVVVGGLQRRFCQQCSRFHNLSEFDEKKRSCRRRLSNHNARRRKPRLDPMMMMPSPFAAFKCTDGRPEMSSVSSNVRHAYSSNSTWASSMSSKFTAKNGCMLNFGLDEQLQLSGTQVPNTISLSGHSFNRLLPSKFETLTRGLKESVVSPNIPEFQSALSLLSNNCWGPSNSDMDGAMSMNRMHHLPLIQGQGFTQNFPPELCQSQTDYLSTNSFSFAATANDTTAPFKPPYQNNALFSNIFN